MDSNSEAGDGGDGRKRVESTAAEERRTIRQWATAAKQTSTSETEETRRVRGGKNGARRRCVRTVSERARQVSERERTITSEEREKRKRDSVRRRCESEAEGGPVEKYINETLLNQ